MKKLILLFVLSFAVLHVKLFGQICGGNPPWCTVGNNIGGGEYLGGDGTSTVPVDLKTLTDYAIRFYTNNATVTTPRMVILGGNSTTGGYVGIGTTTPYNRLTVSGNADVTGNIGAGVATPSFNIDANTNINIDNPGTNDGYRLNGTTVLQCPGSDVYAGRDAGVNASGNAEQVFVGQSAGNACTGTGNATSNTYVGFWAGKSNVSGGGNTCIGDNAGGSATSGGYNTFVGMESGLVATGGNNTFMGFWAGRGVIGGGINTYIGYEAGLYNVSGSNNTFVGTIGTTNTAPTTISSSTALGTGAYVLDNNKMILGNNSCMVGIGLSNVSGGPARRLQIDGNGDANPQLRLSQTYNTIWTDFQTTSAGDLFINPSASGIDRKVGVNTSSPQAVLTVNGANVTSAAGDVFRTDGVAGTTQTWRMFKGSNEHGQLFSNGSSTNFTVQASRNHLNFNSGFNGTGIEAMRIVGGNAANAGFVGIGNYQATTGGTNVFSTAQNQLHQYIHCNSNVYHQFTNLNTSTGSTVAATDGFKLGITYNSSSGKSDAELISQQSGANMNFLTNGLGHMQLLANGNVGVGDYGTAFTAARKLDVYDPYNPQLRLTFAQGATPVNTEFSTTSIGNLYIHPVYGANEGNVGIGTSVPTARLHVATNYTPSATLGSFDGAKIDLNVTYGSSAGSATNNGLLVSTNAGAGSNPSGYTNGIQSYVTGGGNYCSGFLSYVNSPTPNAHNFGYYSILNDNATAANPTPYNFGFLTELSTSTISGTNSANYGFKSLMGASTTSFCPGTMTGLDILNYAAQTNRGITVQLYSENTSSTGSGTTSYGITCSTSPATGSTPDAYAVKDNKAGIFTAGYGITSNHGLDVSALSGLADNTGIYAKAIAHSTSSVYNTASNMAGNFEALYGNENKAVRGFARADVSSNTINYSGHFIAWYGPGENIAVKAEAVAASAGSTMNYGVYSVAATSCTGTTSTGSCTSAAVYADGAVFTTNDYWKSSDNMLKTNVNDITNSKSLLMQ